jgi:L-alanine-DL-glutamate epimerase-like enolase superfamily enzyme
MKITAITPYPAWVGIRNQLLVKVETDEGVFGWGESGLSGREKAVVGAIEHSASSCWAATRSGSARSGRRCIAANISRAGAC